MYMHMKGSLIGNLIKVHGGRHLIFNIILGGVIIVLANKSTMTHVFTLLSASVMISNLNIYQKPPLNPVGTTSLSKFTTCIMK